MNGPEIDRLYREAGHRQTIYIAVEGEEKLFPEYFPSARQRIASGRRVEMKTGPPRAVQSMLTRRLRTILHGRMPT